MRTYIWGLPSDSNGPLKACKIRAKWTAAGRYFQNSMYKFPQTVLGLDKRSKSAFYLFYS